MNSTGVWLLVFLRITMVCLMAVHLKRFVQVNEFGMGFWNLGGGRCINTTSISLLGPLENSRHANAKSGSGNVIPQRHMKFEDCDKSVVHFEVSELQRKLVVHGIIS